MSIHSPAAAGLGSLLTELGEDPGDRTTEECLAEVARTATLFYESSFPIAASLFAEPVPARARTVARGIC